MNEEWEEIITEIISGILALGIISTFVVGFIKLAVWIWTV